MKNLKNKSKLQKFKKQEVVNLNALGGALPWGVTITVTTNWSEWFDGSFFTGNGGRVNEFDKK